MPKKNRLSRADLNAIRHQKQFRVHGELFSLVVAPHPTPRKTSVAFVVSKKVSSRAVTRNEIKRRSREIVRTALTAVKEPAAFVFHAKREAASASFDHMKKDITTLFERARMRGTMPKI
jgi:ribonuclease P protein component